MDRPYPVGLILSAAFTGNVSYILDKEAGMKNAKTVEGRSDYGNGFFKTSPIAAESRSQLACSLCRYFPPGFVRE